MKTDPTQRPPSDDEFVDAGHNVDIVQEPIATIQYEDLVFEESDKFAEKLESHFSIENQIEKTEKGE